MKSNRLLILIAIFLLAGSCRDEDFIRDLAEAIDAADTVSHENPGNYIWDSTQMVQIILEGNAIRVDPDTAPVYISGSKATLTSPGTYSISGSLANGQINVNTEGEGIVRLILNGADINYSSGSPLNILQADKALIYLEDQTDNYLSDGESYIYDNPGDDESNAAIFSRDDLTIAGSGSLTVEGNFNDGIACKDGLIIAGGVIRVDAADDGIRGKDYLKVKHASITVNAGGDGLKSDNDGTAAGYITIESGTLVITSGGDALQAMTDVLISDGEMILVSGGGSSARIAETLSAKGIKAGRELVINGGTLTVNSADDAVHSDGYISINGGTLFLSTGDDGVHSDFNLVVNAGDIYVDRSYEGLESADSNITINGGNIHLRSSDDGINVAGGGEGFGMGGPGRPGPGQPAPGSSGDFYLFINGGHTVVNADGDGIDINGNVEMSGGNLIIVGPTSNNNGALDYYGSFNISGGTLIAAGSSGMAQAPSESSTQYSLQLTFKSAQPARTLIHLQTNDGEGIISFQPSKNFASVVISSPAIKNGSAYRVYYGGSSTGTLEDYIYKEGTYTPGSLLANVTISRKVTKIY